MVTDEETTRAAAAPTHQREGLRWQSHQAVEVVQTSGRLQPRWTGTVVDASLGGLGLVCDVVDVGPGTELAVRLPDGNWAVGTVRHTAEIPEGLRIGIVVTRASGQLVTLFPSAEG